MLVNSKGKFARPKIQNDTQMKNKVKVIKNWKSSRCEKFVIKPNTFVLIAKQIILASKTETNRCMNHRRSAGEGVFKLEEASRICPELLLLC